MVAEYPSGHDWVWKATTEGADLHVFDPELKQIVATHRHGTWHVIGRNMSVAK